MCCAALRLSVACAACQLHPRRCDTSPPASTPRSCRSPSQPPAPSVLLTWCVWRAHCPRCATWRSAAGPTCSSNTWAKFWRPARGWASCRCLGGRHPLPLPALPPLRQPRRSLSSSSGTNGRPPFAVSGGTACGTGERRGWWPVGQRGVCRRCHLSRSRGGAPGEEQASTHVGGSAPGWDRHGADRSLPRTPFQQRPFDPGA